MLKLGYGLLMAAVLQYAIGGATDIHGFFYAAIWLAIVALALLVAEGVRIAHRRSMAMRRGMRKARRWTYPI